MRVTIFAAATLALSSGICLAQTAPAAHPAPRFNTGSSVLRPSTPPQAGVITPTPGAVAPNAPTATPTPVAPAVRPVPRAPHG